MANLSGQRGGVATTDKQRATAVAILAEHVNVLEQAEQEGDDDRWDDIASDGVEVVVGRVAWAWQRWMECVPADLQFKIGSAAFGEGDLIGTVPASCRSGGYSASVASVRSGASRIEKWPWPGWIWSCAPGIASANRRACWSGTVVSASPWWIEVGTVMDSRSKPQGRVSTRRSCPTPQLPRCSARR